MELYNYLQIKREGKIKMLKDLKPFFDKFIRDEKHFLFFEINGDTCTRAISLTDNDILQVYVSFMQILEEAIKCENCPPDKKLLFKKILELNKIEKYIPDIVKTKKLFESEI